MPMASAMKKDDFRIIHKSAPIINGPYAYNSDLPADLKAAIAKAFTESPTKDKAAFDRCPTVRRKASTRRPPRTGTVLSS